MFPPALPKQSDLLRKRVNSSPPFNPLVYPSEHHMFPPTHPEQRHLLRKRVNSSPPFNPFKYPLEHHLFPQTHPEKRESTKEASRLKPPFQPPHIPHGGEDLHPDTRQAPVSVLSPYSRKPGLFGPNVSIFAKGVSRGVHNIAFLLSPDRFCAFDLYFFSMMCTKSIHSNV